MNNLKNFIGKVGLVWVLPFLTVLLITFGHAPVAKEPVVVGVLEAKTGVMAVLGKSVIAGIELAFEEIGYEVAGRKIKLVIDDSEFSAEVIRTKTPKLVEKDKVVAILGITTSAGALAIKDYMNAHKVPLLLTYSTTPKVEPGPKNPYVFRPYFNSPQLYSFAGKYCHDKLRYKTAVTIVSDYVAGHETEYAWRLGFERAGGKVVHKIAIPFGTADHAPYIATIKELKGVDFVCGNIWGADAIRFVKQQAEFRLGIPLVVVDTMVSDGIVLPSLGKEALGLKSYAAYGDVDTAENRAFTGAYRKKTGLPTNGDVYNGYLNAMVLIKAIESVKGNVEDKDAFVKALRNVRFKAPTGPFWFDEYQGGIVHYYYLEVREVKGELRNVVLDTVPNVETPRDIYELVRAKTF